MAALGLLFVPQRIQSAGASYGLSLVDAPGVLARGIWLAVSRINGASLMPDELFLRNGPS